MGSIINTCISIPLMGMNCEYLWDESWIATLILHNFSDDANYSKPFFPETISEQDLLEIPVLESKFSSQAWFSFSCNCGLAWFLLGMKKYVLDMFSGRTLIGLYWSIVDLRFCRIMPSWRKVKTWERKKEKKKNAKHNGHFILPAT